MAIPQDFTIEEYKCLICMESSESLRYCDCSHALCDKCLQIYNQATVVNQASRTVKQCPICRRDRLSGRSDKKNKKTCDMCARSDESSYASYWCQECSDALCDTCFSYHTRLKQSINHRVISLRKETTNTDVLRESSNNTFSYSLCAEHSNEDKPRNFYCRSHRVTCCILCLSSTHSKCKEIYRLEDIEREKFQSSTLPQLRAIRYQLNTLIVTNNIECEKMKQMFETNKNLVKLSVENAKETMDKLYREFEKILFMKNNMVCRQFNQRCTDLEQFQNIIGHFEKKISEISQTEEKEEVLILMDSLKEVMQENFQKLKQVQAYDEKQHIEVSVNEAVRQVSQMKSLAEIKTSTYRIQNNFENLETVVSEISATPLPYRHSNEYVNSLELPKSPEIKYISTSDYGTYSESPNSSNEIITSSSSDAEVDDELHNEEKRDELKFHLTECLKIKEVTIKGHIGQCRHLYTGGKLLFRDYKHEQLYVFETTGKFLFQKDLDRKPSHIVSNKSNDIYISFPKSWFIRRYKKSKSGLSVSGTINMPPGVKLFDLLENYIVVTLKDCIKVLSYGGLVIKTIFIKGRKPLIATSLKNPYFVYNDHVEVVCLSAEDEKEVFRFSDHDLTQEPINMAIDLSETLYIFHKRTDGKLYIQLISNEGKPLRLVKPSMEWYENIDYIGFDREKRYFLMTSVICHCTATKHGKRNKNTSNCETIINIHDMPHNSLDSEV